MLSVKTTDTFLKTTDTCVMGLLSGKLRNDGTLSVG